ncbi:A/G-specific adenine glycosylase [Litorimonas cladophorae]|uniref:Adenine DNA glycosylase n=1 Tax=Litorimonas cladophorae TaxID=1220491 RepID=A0A918KIV1_9PROT|nr:A/G-specific adenine glycosylase [Litorimonas cladophorae]GGX64347.1 A/G-specific adenine glycosylase [Litorimonas cladophorae]
MHNVSDMRAALLRWYDEQGRTLPWRVRPEDRAAGVVPDPYAIWLSEVMSQQTTLAHATPYWRAFLEAFPSVVDLADANRDVVLSMWAGLGYYARARNLHKCAGVVRDDHLGIFPTDEKTLLTLPGIGPYTAATIAAICADEATNIVDGNVERVISRTYAFETPLPKGRKALRDLSGTLVRADRPGDYGQALMDLGATICSPKNPTCLLCPWREFCVAHSQSEETKYPVKVKKKPTPIRYGHAYVLRCEDKVLVERRPDSGLLGGMIGVPTTDWGDAPTDHSQAPLHRNWESKGQIRHVFTHFELRLDVFAAEIEASVEGVWVDDTSGLPTVFTKVVEAGLAD